MTSSALNVLLPLEIANRELDAALFLACAYAGPSRRVFLGTEPALLRASERMRGGLVVGQFPILGRLPLGRENLPKYRALKQRGFVYLNLASEGAVFRGDENRWRELLAYDLDPKVLDEDDYVCTWGRFQRDFYRSAGPPCAKNVRATGHPRFDLLKQPYHAYFAHEVAGLRSRFGSYVLVNTNMPLANSALGVEVMFSERRGYSPRDPKSRIAKVDRWSHQMRALASLIRLIHRASCEFPRTTFVVRPHPSESPSLYRTVLAGLPNVEIIHEGSVIPWLLASAVVVHGGCTTGLEAFLAGANVISFRSENDPNHDVLLASSFGASCRTEREVLEQLHQVLVAGEVIPRGDVPAGANELLENLRADSFQALVEVMEEAEERLSTRPASPSPAVLRQAELREAAVERCKGILRPYFRDRYRKWRYQQSKFAGFERAVVERKVDEIGRVLGRDGLRPRHYSAQLLCIEAC